jgi:Na+-driven multidrug efflux pump
MALHLISSPWSNFTQYSTVMKISVISFILFILLVIFPDLRHPLLWVLSILGMVIPAITAYYARRSILSRFDRFERDFRAGRSTQFPWWRK